MSRSWSNLLMRMSLRKGSNNYWRNKRILPGGSFIIHSKNLSSSSPSVSSFNSLLLVQYSNSVPSLTWSNKRILNKDRHNNNYGSSLSRRGYSSLPSHIKVSLPSLSPTMEMGTIISWEKKEGAKLNEGDVLAEIETDKATMAFETPEEGYLAKIIIPAGTKNIPIGKLVCIIVENESDVAAFKDYSDDGSSAASSASSSAPPSSSASESSSSSSSPAPNVPHTAVPLPALSPTMELGTIISWEKKEGDVLNEGDLLAEIETDKATMGFETPQEGFLAKIIVPAGTKSIPIGKIVCIIVENKEDVAAFKDYVPGEIKAASPGTAAAEDKSSSSSTPPVQQQQQQQQQSQSQLVSMGDRVFASPLARATAAQRGLDLSTIAGQGSGMFGSITLKDLEKAGSAVGAAAQATRAQPISGAPYTDTEVSNIRSVIAKRLLLSKQTIPHYYLTSEIEMDTVLKLREQFNKNLEKEKIKISVNDFVIKAAAMASMKVPEANSAWLDSVIRQYSSVDISVAVSTERGLITPIVFSAERKGLVEISQNVKELAAKARLGKLQPHEFQGGTFSVSNLGMYGIHHFSAIINPPQSCILAIGSTSQKVVPADNEKGYKGITVMYATLSCDHRVVDGAIGATWLSHFKSFLANPAAMIL